MPSISSESGEAAGTNGVSTVSGGSYAGNDILKVSVQGGGVIIDNNGFAGAINMPMVLPAPAPGRAGSCTSVEGIPDRFQ